MKNNKKSIIPTITICCLFGAFFLLPLFSRLLNGDTYRAAQVITLLCVFVISLIYFRHSASINNISIFDVICVGMCLTLLFLIFRGHYANEFGQGKLITALIMLVAYGFILPRVLFSDYVFHNTWKYIVYVLVAVSVILIVTSPFYFGRTNFLSANPVWVARFIGLIGLFSAAFMMSRRGKSYLYGFVLIVLSATALFTTGSRGPLVAMTICVSIILLKNSGQKFIWFAGVLLVLLLIFGQYTSSTGDIGAQLSYRYTYATIALQVTEGARQQLYLLSIELIKDRFGGWGAGGFADFHYLLYPHNLMLEIAVEFGIVPGVIFSMAMLYLLVTAIKLCLASSSNDKIVFISALIIYSIINSLFSGNLSSPNTLVYSVATLYFWRRRFLRTKNKSLF